MRSSAFANDDGFPIKPQKIVWDLREVLGSDDIAISDVGAHKMWMARMYRAEQPNTCIISNGFASMGIAVPGAIAAKLAYPNRKIVAVTGDAGFMMNSQEIETAVRLRTPFVILIWNDSEYGLITWHQLRHFGRSSHIAFQNPDFVKYAESFACRRRRRDRRVPRRLLGEHEAYAAAGRAQVTTVTAVSTKNLESEIEVKSALIGVRRA